MTGLLDNLPASVLLSRSSNVTRKYAHTLEWINVGGRWVGTHSAKANAFVKVLLRQRSIPELLPYTDISCEVKYGEKSRVDFVLEGGSSSEDDEGAKKKKRRCYVEVKSVTLAENTAEVCLIAHMCIDEKLNFLVCFFFRFWLR